ncbi:MAG: SDR family NAD(P)-dependent oxidoreductase, partial [Calditrichaeota bacterium]|nr:SDR family NAD(P)-dependent oxidoreductase [Calditrichota bacterium]
ACAESFAGQGVKLILTARRQERLEMLAEKLGSEYSISCHIAQLDVRNQVEVETLVNNLPEDFRNINILINNAGLARGFSTFQEGSISDWEEMIDTNLKGLLFVSRTIIPGMIERENGHIINIGSIAGRQAYPNGNIYCATKFAVRALNQSMLIDLVDTPVRVSTVDPGLVQTEFSQVRFRGDDEKADAIYANMTPLSAEDIADSVLFCATRPQHVNISEMVVLPTDQASPYHVRREE